MHNNLAVTIRNLYTCHDRAHSQHTTRPPRQGPRHRCLRRLQLRACDQPGWVRAPLPLCRHQAPLLLSLNPVSHLWVAIRMNTSDTNQPNTLETSPLALALATEPPRTCTDTSIGCCVPFLYWMPCALSERRSCPTNPFHVSRTLIAKVTPPHLAHPSVVTPPRSPLRGYTTPHLAHPSVVALAAR